MWLTRAAEYAIRCVLYLTQQGRGVLVKRQKIADEADIPSHFLAKIAQDLARAGLIEIRQGSVCAHGHVPLDFCTPHARYHLADNLIPLLALVGGTIKTDKITGHIRSNIYVCEQFLDVAFSIDENQKRITTGPWFQISEGEFLIL